MYAFSGFMGEDAGAADILTAELTGLRLSLKSAGAVALLSFLFVTLPSVALKREVLTRGRLFIGMAASFLLAVLFLARFPYYEAFHETYNLGVFAGAHDDLVSIFWMMVEEYGLVPRLLGAIVLTALCFFALSRLLRLGTGEAPRFLLRWPWPLTLLLSVAVTFLFMLFCRFGGGFSYGAGINWESAGTTKDAFLNECILDDFQALYRAHASEERMQKGDIAGVEKGGELAAARELSRLSGSTGEGESVEALLTRRAGGARIEKPTHIFIILGESLAAWPLLDKYAPLGAADDLKALAADDDGYMSLHFMPNGDFTSIAITGMITGLPDVNIRANYALQSFKKPYPTAIAEPFQRLGYRANFYYGGTGAWDNIERLALAQGFDGFYGYPELGAPKVTTWGSDDAHLFNGVLQRLREDSAPSLNVIMTVSNHPPYTMDLAAEGMDEAAETQLVKEIIPAAEKPESFARELLHYKYMCREISRFVREARELYPDSLFVVVGDHAVRSNPGPHPTFYELQAVPFILYGTPKAKELFAPNAVGGHIGIAPTLLELIAPAGFEYHAIGLPIGKARAAFNRDYFLTDSIMGKIAGGEEPLPFAKSETPVLEEERAMLEQEMTAMRTVAYYYLAGEEP